MVKTKDLHQSIKFKASSHDLFDALMDSKKHTDFTGAEAKISRKVGGKFSAWDDWAEGKNLEIVPDKKIVQTWRGSDWPKGHYSTITFEFKKMDKGTRLDFNQKGIPEEFYDDIAQGWNEWYWEKLKQYFKEK
jgi:activator of HSP90 ATPase